jgi:hypothetical protein
MPDLKQQDEMLFDQHFDNLKEVDDFLLADDLD